MTRPEGEKYLEPLIMATRVGLYTGQLGIDCAAGFKGLPSCLDNSQYTPWVKSVRFKPVNC